MSLDVLGEAIPLLCSSRVIMEVPTLTFITAEETIWGT